MQSVLVEDVLDKIVELLADDAELQAEPCGGRIFQDIEEIDVYPVLVVSGVYAENLRNLYGNVVWKDCALQVVCRDRGGTNKAKLVLIARRVQLLLQGLIVQPVAPDYLYIGKIGEARQRPRGPENINGKLYPQIVLEFDTKAYRTQ
jgi:hypothetical protein